MKRHKCPRCKRSMYFGDGYKKRRGFGPFGWYYVAEWWCACGYRCSIRTTKKDWATRGCPEVEE